MRLLLRFALLLSCLAVSAGPLSAAEPGDWRQFIGPEKLALLESVKTLPAAFHVSPEGNDAWSGKLALPNAEGTDGPFRSLEKAREAVRRMRAAGLDGAPTVVEIQPGLYELEKALELTSADSGTAASPVIWRGVCGENGLPLSVIRGGKSVFGGKPVEDQAILARLKPGVRGKVLEYDLRALGITDYGTLDGSNTAELFCGGEPMTVARFPNEGYITFSRVDEEDNQERIDQGKKGVVVPKIYVDDGDIGSWAAEPDLWAFGYWFWDWASGRQKVIRIDPERKLLELGRPYHAFGYLPGKYFYIYHALCELDVPGEYYIDAESGKLYFYPPEEVTQNNLYLSTADTFVEGDGLEHLVLAGLCLEVCRGVGVRLSGSGILVSGCLIRNTAGDSVTLDGDQNLFFGNLLYNIGGHGLILNSGDQPNLVPGGSAVVNNDFHHFGRIQRVYAPVIRFSGCGDLVAYNRISDAPHAGIFFSGNEQRIERNEIYGVCRDSNDVGGIYTGGNWTMRGNIIKQNYLHDLTGYQNYWCVGVYLDDMFSSADIVENIFRNVKIPVMIGGGRDNSVANNLFIDCRWCIDLDARAMDWAFRAADAWLKEIEEKGTISGVDYRSELWAKRYPRLAAIAEGTPKAPEGNLIERNLVIKTGRGDIGPEPFEGDRIRDEARGFIVVRDNVLGSESLLDEVTQNEKTPIPGTNAVFRRIPAERIGVFEDPNAISRW